MCCKVVSVTPCVKAKLWFNIRKTKLKMWWLKVVRARKAFVNYEAKQNSVFLSNFVCSRAACEVVNWEKKIKNKKTNSKLSPCGRCISSITVEWAVSCQEWFIIYVPCDVFHQGYIDGVAWEKLLTCGILRNIDKYKNNIFNQAPSASLWTVGEVPFCIFHCVHYLVDIPWNVSVN